MLEERYKFGYLHGDGYMVLEICLEEEWCVSSVQCPAW